MIRHIILISVLLIHVLASPLTDFYKQLQKKQDEVKFKELSALIQRNVPQGIDPPRPAIAEYETFKQDRLANFIHDGKGNVVFRQFRRAKLSDILGRHVI